MKTLLFLLALWPGLNALAETVYKSVDEAGNVIFSDRPGAEAETLDLQPAPTIKNPNPPAYRPPPAPVAAPAPYHSLTITSPQNDQGLRSNTGDFSVALSLSPPLKPGHRIIITLDGREIANGAETRATVKNADRGSHILGARVIDAAGQTLITTSSIFHLLRVAR